MQTLSILSAQTGVARVPTKDWAVGASEWSDSFSCKTGKVGAERVGLG